MSEDYWEGALWVYQADITNGAGGDGDQSYIIVPGEGNELEILAGEVFNGDTVARIVTVTVDDGTNQLYLLHTQSVGGGVRVGFPTGGDVMSAGIVSGGSRHILAGTMRLVVLLASVGASDDSALGLICRIRGGLPTVTEAGASTPTININTEQVF